MPEKGFDLKVLIPTNDGFTIAKNGIEKALYYLMYNLSNRNYQLAGKIKAQALYEANFFDFENFIQFLELEGVELIIDLTENKCSQYYQLKIVSEKDISLVLNNLIDEIDQKRSKPE